MSQGAYILEQITIKMTYNSWKIFKIENKNGLIKLIDNKEYVNYFKSK